MSGWVDTLKNVGLTYTAVNRINEAVNKWQQWSVEKGDFHRLIPTLLSVPIGFPGEHYKLEEGQEGFMALRAMQLDNKTGTIRFTEKNKIPSSIEIKIPKNTMKGLYVIKHKLGITEERTLLYIAALFISGTVDNPHIDIRENGAPYLVAGCEKVLSDTLRSTGTAHQKEDAEKHGAWGSYMLRYTAEASQVFQDIGSIPPTVQVLLLFYKLVTFRCTLGEMLKKYKDQDIVSGNDLIIVKRALTYMISTVDDLFTLAWGHKDLVHIRERILKHYNISGTPDDPQNVTTYLNILNQPIITEEQKLTSMNNTWWNVLFPPQIDNYQNVIESMRTKRIGWVANSTDYINSGVYMGYALVISSLMGGLVFQIWYQARRKAVLHQYPKRKELIDRAYKLFRFRNSLKGFTLLKATLVKRPLSVEEQRALYRVIQDAEDKWKMASLLTNTDLPIQTRHYALGSAVYLFLMHRILFWAKKWYNWATIPGKDAAYEGVRNNVLAVAGILGFKGMEGSMEGNWTHASAILIGIFSIILVPSIMSLFPVLNPFAAISFLASIFSFIEYAFRDLFKLLVGGGDLEASNEIARKLVQIREFAESKADYIRLKRKELYNDYYQRTGDLEDRGYRVEKEMEKYAYAPYNAKTMHQIEKIRNKLLEDDPQAKTLNEKVDHLRKGVRSANWIERTVRKKDPRRIQSATRAADYRKKKMKRRISVLKE